MRIMPRPLFSTAIPSMALSLTLTIATIGCSERKDDMTEKVQQVLKNNPQLAFNALKAQPEQLLTVLREYRKELFHIVQAGAEEAQHTAQLKRRQHQLENPLTPALDFGRAVRGNPAAPIAIVAYSDFQCPYCAQAEHFVAQLPKAQPERFSFRFKHLPMPKHKKALTASRFFEAATIQNQAKAWQLHDLLFQKQDDLENGDENWIKKQAISLGLDPVRLIKDMQSDVVRERIKADIAEGDAFEIPGTPSFVVGGVLLTGIQQPKEFEEVARTVEEYRKRPTINNQPQPIGPRLTP
ncbi:Disulfide bond formation protein DsbA [Desulfovibrionales bacterium]